MSSIQPTTITTADPIMKQARFNPSPVTFCNLPTVTLQKIQTFFRLRERSTLPLVCDEFRGAKPLVPSEKTQFDELKTPNFDGWLTSRPRDVHKSNSDAKTSSRGDIWMVPLR